MGESPDEGFGDRTLGSDQLDERWRLGLIRDDGAPNALPECRRAGQRFAFRLTMSQLQNPDLPAAETAGDSVRGPGGAVRRIHGTAAMPNPLFPIFSNNPNT